MSRPLPAPKAADTTEETRAWWADTDRQRESEYLDQPMRGEE